ncbi:MAG: hypothetical protein IKN24_06665, partial [Lachnospiraceae bacterium]|nr:hypothetical protein [Lachnospiraceae bacterium]
MTTKRSHNSIFRRATSFVLSAAMVLSSMTVSIAEGESSSIPEVMDSASAVNYATILGRATDYGIVAREFHQDSHMETTYAIKEFYNSGHANEVDFTIGTVQFLIGAVKEGRIIFGAKQEADVYNIEASNDVLTKYNDGGIEKDYYFSYPWIDSNGNIQGHGVIGNFDIQHNYVNSGKTFSVYGSDATNGNIDLIIDNVRQRSGEINTKATTGGYAINPDDYRVGTDDYVLDLSDERFTNKVVYINVDNSSQIKDYISSDCGLRVIKDSSTIVAFNIDKNVKDILINTMLVSVDGGENWIKSTTGSSGNPYNNHGDHNDLVDTEICQKFIWNINQSEQDKQNGNSVVIQNTAGMFLIPNDLNVRVSGSSAGWIVTNGKMTIDAEWHYIYKGGSQEVMRDGAGQIHFAARKALTDRFDGENTVEDKSALVAADTFSFDFFETTSGSEVLVGTVKNFATNTIKFPTLTFYNDTYTKRNIASYETTYTQSYNFETGNNWYSNQALKNALFNNPAGVRIIIQGYKNYNDVESGVLTLTANNNSVERTVTDGWFWISYTGTQFLNMFNITNPFFSDVNLNVTSEKNDYGQDIFTISSIGYEVDSKYYKADRWGDEFINALKSNPENVTVSVEYTDNSFSYGGNSNIGILVNGVTKGSRSTSNGTHTITLTGSEIIGMLGSTQQSDINNFEIGLYNGVVPGRVSYTIIDPYENKNNPNYIPEGGDGKTFTYRIREKNAGGVDMPGVLNSDGYIDITLNVKSENGVLKYTVSSVTKLGDSNKTTYKTNANVPMSGVEFTLGAFFNLKNGAFEFEKTDEDGQLLSGAQMRLYKIDDDGRNAKLYSYGYYNEANIGATQNGNATGDMSPERQVNGQGVGTYDYFMFTTAEVKTVLFNLPEGRYKLVEQEVPKGYAPKEFEKAEDIIFTVDANGVVSVDDKAVSIIKMVDHQKTAPGPRGTIVLKKTINGELTEEEKDGLLTFLISKVEPAGTKYLKRNGTLANSPEEGVITLTADDYDSASGEYIVRISNIPDGEYTVTETTQSPDGKSMSVTYKLDDGASQNGSSAALSVHNNTKTVEFDDTFTRDKGTIVITKTISGDLTAEEIAGALKFLVSTEDNGTTKYLKADGTLVASPEDAVITLTKANGELNSFVTVDANGKYTITLSNVPTGNYTVTETTVQPDGCTMTVSYKLGDAEPVYAAAVDVAVAKDVTTTVAYDDAFTRNTPEYGTIILKKTIQGELTEAEKNGLLKFTVTTDDNGTTKYLKRDGSLTTEESEGTITLEAADYDSESGEYIITLANVPNGSYTVTETTQSPDGKTMTVSYSLNGGQAQQSNTADVTVNGDTNTVEFDDTFTRDKGTIVITKTIAGDLTAEEIAGDLKFLVSTEDNGTTKYLKADGTLVASPEDAVITLTKANGELNSFVTVDANGKYKITLSNVPTGNYTVTETTVQPNGYTMGVSYKLNGGSSQEGSVVDDVEVTKGETATVDFNDDFTRDRGELIITKNLSGDITEEEAKGGLKFEIKRGENEWVDRDGSISSVKVEYTLNAFTPSADGKTYTLSFTGGKSLETDVYTVIETNSSVAGYTESVSYKVNGGASTSDKATVTIVKDETANVVIDDAYTRDKGTIVITKTISGDLTAEEIAGDLKFLVSTEDNGTTKYLKADGTLVASPEDAVITLTKANGELNSFVTVDANGKYKITLSNAPTGNYTVTETTVQPNGYTMGVSYKLNGGSSQEGSVVDDVEVTKGETATVDFNDDFTRD